MLRQQLCGVCGKVLGEWVFYVGGEATLRMAYSSTPACPATAWWSRLGSALPGQRERDYRRDLPVRHEADFPNSGRPASYAFSKVTPSAVFDVQTGFPPYHF